MIKRIIIVSFLFLLLPGLNAQIVNIEALRMRTNNQVFKMLGDASFSYNNNDGESNYTISSSLGATLKSKNTNHIFFLLGNYSLSRYESQDLQNSWFTHFRYNYQQTETFRWEAFTQGQGNKILDVELRYLIGAGSRLKFVLKKATDKDNDTGIRCYIGNASMYEFEKSSTDSPNLYQHRHNAYLSLSVNIPGKLDIINTLYYQPLYRDFGDYRVSNDFSVSFPITKEELSFYASYNYSFDSFTPLNRSQFTSNIFFGISFTLASKPMEPQHWHLKK